MIIYLRNDSPVDFKEKAGACVVSFVRQGEEQFVFAARSGFCRAKLIRLISI